MNTLHQSSNIFMEYVDTPEMISEVRKVRYPTLPIKGFYMYSSQ